MKIQIKLLSIMLIMAMSEAHAQTAPSHYTEDMYSDFSKFSSGIINFKINTLRETNGSEIAKQTFSGLLGYPLYSLEVASDATKILSVSFTDKISQPDFESTSETFEQYNAMGLPIENAVVRLVEVVATIGKASQKHTAVELCWPKQDYCHVVDLTMPEISNEVRNIRRLKAEGYHAEVKNSFEEAYSSKATTNRCRIVGTTNSASTWYNKSSYIKRLYKNNGDIGMELDVGAVYFGVACKLESNGNCDARPFITTAEGTNIEKKYAWWWSAKCPAPVSDAFNGSNWPNAATATAYVRNGCGYSSSSMINATASFTQKYVGTVNTDASLTVNASAFNNGSRISASCENY